MFTQPPPEVSIDVGVMYLPTNEARTEHAENIAEQFEQDPYIEEVNMVAADPSKTLWDTAERCYRHSLDLDTTHHIAIQDDIEPCENFGEVMHNALRAVPNRLVSAFSVYQESVDDAAQRQNWFRSTGNIWGACPVIPAQHIQELIDWRNQYFHRNAADDFTVACWNKFEGPGDIWHMVPSVVEHIEDELGGSTMGHNPPCQRTAKYHVRELGKHPTDIDWSFNIENVPIKRMSIKSGCLNWIEKSVERNND